MKKFYPLRNPIREYAWGSTEAIADLLGRPKSDSPQAELWLGAHPSAPSELKVDVDADEDDVDANGRSEGAGSEGGSEGARHLLHRHPLHRWISDHREEVLGPQTAQRWRHLPFLLKVLAADKPLSIQAHPDAEQARRGFAAEEAAGVPRDAAERNYPDDRHKPELIYALTPFTVLRGFREPADARRRFEDAGLGRASCLEALRVGDTAEQLRGLLRRILEAPSDVASPWVETALGEISRRGPRDDAEAWLPRLADEYGLDRGVLGPLFLHVFQLAPGEALYTGAGVLHAYLEGLGIEIMASSDNVLRGGLTVKHVDPEELVKVVRYEPLPPRRTEGVATDGELRFDTPADEFSLSLLRPAGGHVDVAGGVQILLCTHGEGELLAGEEAAPFRRGDSFLVPHATGGFRLAGDAEVFRASLPSQSLN